MNYNGHTFYLSLHWDTRVGQNPDFWSFHIGIKIVLTPPDSWQWRAWPRPVCCPRTSPGSRTCPAPGRPHSPARWGSKLWSEWSRLRELLAQNSVCYFITDCILASPAGRSKTSYWREHSRRWRAPAACVSCSGSPPCTPWSDTASPRLPTRGNPSSPWSP